MWKNASRMLFFIIFVLCIKCIYILYTYNGEKEKSINITH